MIVLANSLYFLHFLIFAVVVFGSIAIIILKNPPKWLKIIYVSISILTALSILVTGECILSRWEYNLRAKLDPSAIYNQGFVTDLFSWFGISWNDDFTLYVGGALIVLGLVKLLISVILDGKR